MQFMTHNGGLYLILNQYFKDGATHYTLLPYDDKARADYKAREARTARHARTRKRHP